MIDKNRSNDISFIKKKKKKTNEFYVNERSYERIGELTISEAAADFTSAKRVAAGDR